MSGSNENQSPEPASVVSPPMLSEPVFLINHNGVYYITLGVWEYDPTKASSPRQHAAISVVDEHFKLASKNGTSHAVALKLGHPPTMTSTTKPPQPAQVPTNPPLSAG